MGFWQAGLHSFTNRLVVDWVMWNEEYNKTRIHWNIFKKLEDLEFADEMPCDFKQKANATENK